MVAEEEGELKKRFKTVIEETILKDSRYDWGEFLAVIDEAKKEFPFIVKRFPETRMPMWREFEKRVKEFGEKWFGKESSEG